MCLDAGDIPVNKTDKNPFYHRVYDLVGLRDSKCQGHSGSMCKEPEVFRVSYQEHNKVTGSNREVLE